jgi:hypothetical protein
LVAAIVGVAAARILTGTHASGVLEELSGAIQHARGVRTVSHSTVTDLAKFLGWSTSQPRRTAM